MLSRALSLATVTLLIGCLTAGVACALKISMPARALPRFSRHLQRLPQEPARPVEERAGFVVAGLSAPALHDRHRHGLGAVFLPDLQRRCRPAVSGQGSEAEGRQAGRRQDGRPDQPDRSAGGSQPHRRRRPPGRMPTAHAARRGRTPGPRAQTVRPFTRGARMPLSPPMAGPGASRDRQQTGQPAEARQAWQARAPRSRRETEQAIRATAKEARIPVAGCIQVRDRHGRFRRGPAPTNQCRIRPEPNTANEAAMPASKLIRPGENSDHQGRCCQGERRR